MTAQSKAAITSEVNEEAPPLQLPEFFVCDQPIFRLYTRSDAAGYTEVIREIAEAAPAIVRNMRAVSHQILRGLGVSLKQAPLTACSPKG